MCKKVSRYSSQMCSIITCSIGKTLSDELCHGSCHLKAERISRWTSRILRYPTDDVFNDELECINPYHSVLEPERSSEQFGLNEVLPEC